MRNPLKLKITKKPDEAYDEDYDYDELDFIIKRFKYLARKNNSFSSKRDRFKGSSSRSKDQDGCYNCKKHGHFIVECSDI